MNLIILVQLLTLICISYNKKYTCVFDQKYKNYKPHLNKGPIRDEPLTMKIHGRQLQVVSRTPIVIQVDQSYFDTIIPGQNGAANTTNAHLQFIQRAMDVATKFYSSRLQVPPMGNVKAPPFCFDFSPPSYDVLQGRGCDLLIYARYITDRNQRYGATGVSCKRFDGIVPDSSFRAGRPIVGRIIFNTYTLLEDQGIVNDQLLLTNRRFSAITATALHETMHILGFDYSLYGEYLNPLDINGDYYDYNQLIKGPTKLHIKRPASYLISSPNVLAWAKDFFGCPNITGMQLENQDGSTPGSHWQRVIMYDQLMTGTQLGAQKSISAVNFAFLKDMGWYDVDGTFNDSTNYGYKKGCDFFNNACYSSQVMSKYFCDPTTKSGISQCSTSNLGKSVCSNQTGLMSDGCGLWQEYMHCVDPDQPDDSVKEQTIQVYGTNSFCVVGTIGRNSVPVSSMSRCYPYVCHNQVGAQKIIFTVGIYSIQCLKSQKGANRRLIAMNGYLQCPDHNDFCVNSRKICKNWCSQRGFCMRGVCNCLTNFSGDDCSKTICKQLTATPLFDTLTGTCVATCPSGYYQNKYSNSCFKCDTKCANCVKQPHICTNCSSVGGVQQVLFNDTCFDECPQKTYLDGNQCKKCNNASPFFCDTCIGTATACTSCISSYYLSNPSQGTCNTGCPDSINNKKDTTTNKCVQNCDLSLRYVIATLICERCNQTSYKWSNDSTNCYAFCPLGFYKDQVKRMCRQCDQICKECFDQYPENCTKCWNNRPEMYLSLKTCVSKCPPEYYKNDTSGACEICSAHNLNCVNCFFDIKIKCSTCKYGYYFQLNNNTCLLNCDQYKYKNRWNHSCNDCSGECGDCTSPQESSCINCRPGKFFLSNQTGGYCLSDCPVENYVKNGLNCLSCHKTCKTCNGMLSKDCSTCVSGLYFSGGYCRYVCPVKTFANTANYQCTACDSNCAFCYGQTVDNCTSCIAGFVLDNNTCASNCSNGMTANNWNVCENFNQYVMGFYFSVLMMGLIVLIN